MNGIEIGLIVVVAVQAFVLCMLWLAIERRVEDSNWIHKELREKVSERLFNIERSNRRDIETRIEALHKYLMVEEHTTKAELVVRLKNEGETK